jgi:hypothetical protein
MLGRQDDEAFTSCSGIIMRFWYDSQILPASLAAMGICSAWQLWTTPQTPVGWLVITHGVGPMRKYCLGAVLLDLNDPSRVIGRLRDPLLHPAPDEREGYVPNVVQLRCPVAREESYIALRGF